MTNKIDLSFVKPYSPKDSFKILKGIVMDYRKNASSGKPDWRNIKPGRVIFFKYDAKDRDHTFDKYPLTLVLKTSQSYMLGLNFHWCESHAKIRLVEKILAMNTDSKGGIRNPLKFTYEMLKPLLTKKGYRLCLRLYIKKRLKSNAIIIDSKYLLDIARMRLSKFVDPSGSKPTTRPY